MENKTLAQTLEQLPLYARIVLTIFWGGIIGGVIRIQTYLESKNDATLIAGLVWACIGDALWIPKILDVVTLIADKKISILND